MANGNDDFLLKLVNLMERMLEMQDRMVNQLERVTEQVQDLQNRLSETEITPKHKLN